MSAKDLTRIIERASSDSAFLNHLNRDPDKALAEYRLSADERAALMAGDPAQLEALGVDTRISKGRPYSGN